MNLPEKEYYEPKIIGAMLGVNQGTVIRWIKQGRINAFRFGKLYKVSKKELNRFMKESSYGVETKQEPEPTLRGMFKEGDPISAEAIDEVIKEWEKE